MGFGVVVTGRPKPWHAAGEKRPHPLIAICHNHENTDASDNSVSNLHHPVAEKLFRASRDLVLSLS